MRYFLDLVGQPTRETEVAPDEVAPEINLSRRNFLIYSAALPSVLSLGLVPGVSEAARRGSPRLEQRIEHYVKGLRLRGMIRPYERTAWSVYDFRLNKKLVSINEDTPLQSASMIKPFVALAFFYRVRESSRRYRYDRKTQSIMEAMIRRSSNSATNYFIERVGRRPKDVERILKSNAPGVFRQTRIIEKIPPGGKTYLNQASAHDYSRFLYGVWHNRFPFSQEMKRLMSLPNKDRIYDGAERIPQGTRVYDKTGTTAKLCGNMGILDAQGRDGRRYPYTFIAIIERTSRARNYGRWIRSRSDVIREVSNLVYSDLKHVHNLV